jgi:hypothetical protein
MQKDKWKPEAIKALAEFSPEFADDLQAVPLGPNHIVVDWKPRMIDPASFHFCIRVGRRESDISEDLFIGKVNIQSEPFFIHTTNLNHGKLILFRETDLDELIQIYKEYLKDIWC